MTANQATLLFMGVILGLFFLCAGSIVCMGKYREYKRKKIFATHKDLRETSIERDKLNHEYCKESNEYTRIHNLIKYELERKPYLTKVKAFYQEKEIEKLRYELEKSSERKQEIKKQYDVVNNKYLELAEKYQLKY